MAAGSGRFPRVAVLKGGMSAEREVSLVSGRECAKALRAAGYSEVIEVDCGPDVAAQLADIKPEVVFNALHGRWGEDGCVQGILEWLRIPYTHSACWPRPCDGQAARQGGLSRAGLPIVDSVIASREAVEKDHVLPPPYVVKPNNEGSSVGVYIVHPGSNAPRLAETMPQEVMVETYAPGRELSISVMGDRALGVTDIITDGWYDYDAKYKPGGSRHQLPANMPEEVTAACLDYALRAHRALGCRGLSRTDIRWDDTRGVAGLVLLETNTQPGMTPTSLAPEQAAYCGVSFPDLCDWLVRDASCNR